MKKITIIFRHSPYGTTASREGLDFALLSASFEQQVSVIFIGEALLHLLPNQQPLLSGSKNYTATFKAMPIYDIDTILVCQQSLSELGLQADELTLGEVVSTEVIANNIDAADEVLVF
ncbi:sulfurtransferase complex subunit TusC [Shewanella maritima]|uniref:sulfurtransferase complex subunit TusC n=1 Tax=Shewanella maritima TaxID=2520507 RepID=UPI00373589D6